MLLLLLRLAVRAVGLFFRHDGGWNGGASDTGQLKTILARQDLQLLPRTECSIQNIIKVPSHIPIK